jgi:hypothetical protein
MSEREPAEPGAGVGGRSTLYHYVITREGRAYVLYQGLLTEAHRRGLRGIRTRLLQSPTGANGGVAVCAATVTTPAGEFTAIGAAGPASPASPATGRPPERPPAPPGPPGRTLIQLAEARAKARALRDALNLDAVPFDELEGEA